MPQYVYTPGMKQRAGNTLRMVNRNIEMMEDIKEQEVLSPRKVRERESIHAALLNARYHLEIAVAYLDKGEPEMFCFVEELEADDN